MKKRKTKILIITGILIVCVYLVFSFFRLRIGPRSGRVVDAVTGEPIEGVVVNYSWKFCGFLIYPGATASSYETTTTS